MLALLSMAVGCAAGDSGIDNNSSWGPVSASAGPADGGATATGASAGVTTANATGGGSAQTGGSSAGDDGAVDTGAVDGAVDTSDDAKPSAECGNGVIEDAEECDGDALRGAACADFGFDGGAVVCGSDCTILTDGCSSCGDGEVALMEVCDGSNVGGETCVSLGFGGGSLGCAADCSALDTSGCAALPSCGDGIVNGGEQCDANDLGGNSCITQGFDLGAIGCTASCTLDLTNCEDDIADCTEQGEFCLFNEDDLQSTCCPPGVGGNILGICDLLFCV